MSQSSGPRYFRPPPETFNMFIDLVSSDDESPGMSVLKAVHGKSDESNIANVSEADDGSFQGPVRGSDTNQ